MESQVYKANQKVKELFYKHKKDGIRTTTDKCRKLYAVSLGYKTWDECITELKEIDKKNDICPRCFNISPFNKLVVCSKCHNRYDENGNAIKGEE